MPTKTFLIKIICTYVRVSNIQMSVFWVVFLPSRILQVKNFFNFRLEQRCTLMGLLQKKVFFFLMQNTVASK